MALRIVTPRRLRKLAPARKAAENWWKFARASAFGDGLAVVGRRGAPRHACIEERCRKKLDRRNKFRANSCAMDHAWGSDHGFSPVRSAGSVLRAGGARVPRAWLRGPTTKAGPERRGGHGTAVPLEEVLRPGYFEVARGLLHPGELIYVSSVPGRARAGEPVPGARVALVMVGGDGRGASSVRLVQDFGPPGDPAAQLADAVAPAPIKRGRGRPPGSRTGKPDQGTNSRPAKPAVNHRG